MSKAAAWIMNINGRLHVSVSQMELVHIINNPFYFNIPNAPAYCQNMIIWNDNILPVVDIASLTNYHASHKERNVVAVVIFRDNNNEVHYGGISQTRSPTLEYVNNSQICQLPELTLDLMDISLSCFSSSDGREVPILDLSKLFSRDYSMNFISNNTGPVETHNEFR